MTVRNSRNYARLFVVALVASAGMAISAGTADAATQVIYNNENTVPLVGSRTEDTYSQCYLGCGYTSAGGIVEFGHTFRKLKSVAVEVDNFICESGTYEGENCSSNPGAKMKYKLTANIYAVIGADERGALLATHTETAKIPYRPTVVRTCPATPEGKGFGPNCDVGGYLSTVTFKGFGGVTLPAAAIIEIAGTTPDVNLGFEEAYKEYNPSNPEAVDGFVGIPGSGMPAVGSDPLSESIFLDGQSQSGFLGALPVFEVIAKK
jgi:hypothetical protein